VSGVRVFGKYGVNLRNGNYREVGKGMQPQEYIDRYWKEVSLRRQSFNPRRDFVSQKSFKEKPTAPDMVFVKKRRWVYDESYNKFQPLGDSWEALKQFYLGTGRWLRKLGQKILEPMSIKGSTPLESLVKEESTRRHRRKNSYRNLVNPPLNPSKNMRKVSQRLGSISLSKNQSPMSEIAP
jgi:hypothetical protein